MKRKKKVLFTIIFSICFQQIIAQKYTIPDSLKTKTYKELFEGLSQSKNNPENDFLYANTYLYKAKNDNDTIKIANGYAHLASLSNDQNGLKYADSIISLTKNLQNDTYPHYGYMIKGLFLYKTGDYEDALSNFLISDKLSHQKNTKIEITVKSYIAEIKLLFGNVEEALKEYKKLFDILNSEGNKNIKNYDLTYLLTIQGLSKSYLLDNNFTEAEYYCKKGIDKSLTLHDSELYYDFVSLSGIIAYHNNSFDKAQDSLIKALPFESFGNALLNNHFYQGKIYNQKNKPEKAFYHFKKADSIYNSNQDVVPEVRGIQEYLIAYYKNNDDIDNQLKYIDRLLKIDSILDSTSKNLNETLRKKYDTPQLLAEKQLIINNLKNKESKFELVIYTLISFIVVATLLVLFLGKKQHRSKKQLKKQLAEKKRRKSFDKKNRVKRNIKGNY